MCSDHDLGAELALRALDGRPSECVRLLLAWRDYRLEPHLVAALIGGVPGMLERQSIPLFGPPVKNPGKHGVFTELEGLVRLRRDFRLKLATASALAMCRRDVLPMLSPDDRISLEQLVRHCLAACIQSLAPSAQVSIAVEVCGDSIGPLLFTRATDDGLVITGRLPLAWLAIFASGLAVHDGSVVASIASVGQKTLTLVVASVSSDGSLGDHLVRNVATDELLREAHVPALGSTGEGDY